MCSDLLGNEPKEPSRNILVRFCILLYKVDILFFGDGSPFYREGEKE
nr:MAG TPA_asm: hypothetical protein [Caudoviricetes sp.]